MACTASQLIFGRHRPAHASGGQRKPSSDLPGRPEDLAECCAKVAERRGLPLFNPLGLCRGNLRMSLNEAVDSSELGCQIAAEKGCTSPAFVSSPDSDHNHWEKVRMPKLTVAHQIKGGQNSGRRMGSAQAALLSLEQRQPAECLIWRSPSRNHRRVTNTFRTFVPVRSFDDRRL